MKVIIINASNLNLLGVREKSIYGNISFEEYFKSLLIEFPDMDLEYFQSNIEGEFLLINYKKWDLVIMQFY